VPKEKFRLHIDNEKQQLTYKLLNGLSVHIDFDEFACISVLLC